MYDVWRARDADKIFEELTTGVGKTEFDWDNTPDREIEVTWVRETSWTTDAITVGTSVEDITRVAEFALDGPT